MIHELKILPEYFEAVFKLEKTFEIRKNDRGFRVGDYLRLKEWDGEKYTGREVTRYVNYILYDRMCGLEDGWCIMNLKISHLKATLDQTGGESANNGELNINRCDGIKQTHISDRKRNDGFVRGC